MAQPDDTIPHWWWEVADLADEGLHIVYDDEVQAEPDDLRLAFYPRHPDYDGEPRIILVDKRTGEPCGSYNVSHTCPPDCS